MIEWNMIHLIGLLSIDIIFAHLCKAPFLLRSYVAMSSYAYLKQIH